jgi:protein O-GlcNAc transferase
VADSSERLKVGIERHQAGKLDEAEKVYREVLAGDAENADALNLMGVLYRQQKKLAEAEELIQRAIARRGDVAGFYNNLGNVLADRKKLREAAEAYRQATRIAPGMAEAHNNLGNVLRELERYGPAEKRLRRALELKPGWGEAHNNLAIVLKHVHRLDEAETEAREAVRLCPQLAEVFNTLGTILKDKWKLAEAEEALRHAIGMSGHYAEAHNNLGLVLERMGRVTEATQSYEAAVQCRADYADAFNNLGNVTSNRGLHEEALGYYRRALQAKPDHAEAGSNLACAMHAHPAASGAEIVAQFEEWARRHAEPLTAWSKAHENDRDPEKRLRVGYVSPDFRNHPVARFLSPIFAHHDHSKFQIVCYSDVKTEDEVTAALRQRADEWYPVAGMSPADLAEMIRGHRIDVLVDLAVHTEGNRMLTFARKPAPVQVTYLGYPGTTGMSAMDYRVTDRLLSPLGAAREGPEKLLRLTSYWCYEAPKEAPEVGPLPASAGKGVTFGCLNNPAKISERCLLRWAKLMSTVQGSRVILFCKIPEDQQRIARLFVDHGVAAWRMEFVSSQPFAQYLATYNRIDVALDPFPYNGGTTSCDALWMGAPLVSLSGDLAVRRSGSSLLGQIGLSELVAETVDAYERIAIDLARDVARLQELRSSLRARMQASPLMDAIGFTRELEAGYREMWKATLTACTR